MPVFASLSQEISKRNSTPGWNCTTDQQLIRMLLLTAELQEYIIARCHYSTYRRSVAHICSLVLYVRENIIVIIMNYISNNCQ